MKKIIETYLNEFTNWQISRAIEDIERVLVILNEAWVYGSQIFTCGNGGSASTASHFASDLAKVGLKSFCLNDNVARATALINDSGWDRLYLEQLELLFKPKDILIAFSVHGGVGQDKADKWSQNLVLAIDYANQTGKSIGIVGFDGGIMRKICTASIRVNLYSTALVESWHLGIVHLLCECLK